VTDGDGKIIHANERSEQVLGLEKDQIAGCTFDDDRWNITNFDGNPIPESELPFNIVKKTGKPIQGVEHAIFPGGNKRRYLTINAVPVRDESGDFNGMVSVAMDITSRAETDKNLHSAERIQSLILKSSPALVVYQDLNHNIVWANRVALDSVGATQQEVAGKKCHQVWQNSDTPCNGCPVTDAIELNEIERAEIETPDGKVWLITGAPVKAKSGETIGAIETTLDITERHRAKNELEDHLRRSKLITDMVVRSSKLDDVEKICDIVGQTIYSLNTDNYVAISFYNPDTESIRIRSLYGLEDDLNTVNNLAGEDVTSLTIDPRIIRTDIDQFVTGNLERVPGGLHTILNENLSKDTCTRIEDFLDISVTYVVGNVIDGDLYGGVAILSKCDDDLEYSAGIETIAGHLAVIMQRKRVENRLKGKVNDLKSLNRAMVGRENRMIELKQKVNELSKKCDQKPPYDLSFLDEY